MGTLQIYHEQSFLVPERNDVSVFHVPLDRRVDRKIINSRKSVSAALCLDPYVFERLYYQ